MSPKLATAAILLVWAMPATAHRLDEYLQATLISVAKDRIQADLRLAPGIAVLPIVLAEIDTDADGSLSETERRAYAEHVLRDLFLTVDGQRLKLHLLSTDFPPMDEMREGRGEIGLRLDATVPAGAADRKLVFENRHQARIAVYLVNSLVPRDPDIRIATQKRNYQQSTYELDYVQAGGRTGLSSLPNWLDAPALTAAAVLLAIVRLTWTKTHRA